MVSSTKSLFFLSFFFVLTLSNRATAQIVEDTSTIELNIFPNPNRGTFYITTIKDESYKSQLYAMDGSLVRTIYIRSGLNYVSITEPAGIYMLIVNRGEEQQQFKIVVR